MIIKCITMPQVDMWVVKRDRREGKGEDGGRKERRDNISRPLIVTRRTLNK